MHKAVPDSNILVSAFIVKLGVPNQILRRSGTLFVLCTCEEILRETERILRSDRIRRKYRYTEEDFAQFLTSFRKPDVAEMLSDLPEVTVIQDDPSDNVILACAQKAEAQFVITGDQHLLQLKIFGRIKIERVSGWLSPPTPRCRNRVNSLYLPACGFPAPGDA